MRRRMAVSAGFVIAAAGVLILGLRSAGTAAELEHRRHAQAVDQELRYAAAEGATRLRALVRGSRDRGHVPGIAVRTHALDGFEPTTPALARARALESRQPHAASDAYLEVILDSDDVAVRSTARRSLARMFVRDGATDAALSMLRGAEALPALPKAELQRVRQAILLYESGTDSMRADTRTLREVATRLVAAPDADQLAFTRDDEVVWLQDEALAIVRLEDLLAHVLPGYAENRWLRQKPGDGRALPAPFPRIWMGPSPDLIAAGAVPAQRVRTAHALPAIVGALGLIGAAVAAWVLLRRQERFEQRRTGFLCAVTHELKTPIANISLYGELIREHGPDDPGKVPEFADVVVREATRLRDRVDEMLAVASGRETLPPSNSTFDPVATTADVVRQFDDPRLELATPETSGRARGAEPLFRRAVEGILSNALRFSAEGPVRVELREDEESWALDVDDCGPGIPAADRERVFEPFVRLDSSLAADQDGTGLGLTLVRQCIEDCGGVVKIESSRTGGTRVHVALERVA
ncbi:MAG: HAMP domain-containing sensor histidine kinase [Planctomycetota bacterium]